MSAELNYHVATIVKGVSKVLSLGRYLKNFGRALDNNPEKQSFQLFVASFDEGLLTDAICNML